jgi:predicted O-methyltransferase YrrM
MNELEIVNMLADEYAARLSTAENDVLRSINEHTVKHHPYAHMLSGHVQGKFLEFISNILQPKHVLEIGTFTGYSAICLAKGIKSDGQLHTIELREEDAQTAKKNFHFAKMDNIITLHIGNALDIIPTLPHQWDMVFIDADKAGYIDYYEMVLPRLSAKGVIIADNVLFHGQVLQEPIKGKNAKAIDAFNKHVASDNRVEQVMLTLRDGLLLIKKI